MATKMIDKYLFMKLPSRPNMHIESVTFYICNMLAYTVSYRKILYGTWKTKTSPI